MSLKMLNEGILLQLFGGANKSIANGGGGGARGRRFGISFFGEDGQRHPSRRVRLRKRVVARDAENKPLVLKRYVSFFLPVSVSDI